MSIEKLERELKIYPKWRCFPLHPETPPEGVLLERLFEQPALKIAKWTEELRKRASQLGLPFGLRRKTFNSRLVQEVGLWAEEQGKGELFQMAVFKAYFVEEQNISSKYVLLQLAASVGLPPIEAGEVIEKRSFRDAVDKDWALAKSMNIKAVPTLVLGEKKLTGAQPYERIVDFVKN